MDEVDRADILQGKLLEASIHNIKRNLEIPLNTTGACLTCGDPVPDGRRWCDADCRDCWDPNDL